MNCKSNIVNKYSATFYVLSGLFGVCGSLLAGTTAYIPGGGGMASVVDTTTQSQTAVISGLGSNYSMSVSPNGSVAYSANYSGGSVTPINTSTNVAGTVIPVGTGPVNVTFSADSSKAYVSNLGANSISVIDVSTGTVSATVTGVCPGSGNPAQSVFNGPKLLIACVASPSTIISMDTSAANALTTLATAQNEAYNIAISTSSGFGYVTNYQSNTITKFDLTSGAATHYPTTGVTRALGLAVTPDGSKIYVADLSGPNLIVMNPSGSVLSTLNLGGTGIAGLGMSSNGSVMYAPLSGSAAGIKVIDTATDLVTATIANPGASAYVIWGDFLGNVSASASPNSAPAATSVAISGTAQAGSTLTGSYIYADADSDAQGSSTFRWVKNNVNTGVGGGTNVGTTSTYTPVAGDVGSFMYYCVTPVAAAGTTTGTEVCSVATSAVAEAVAPTPTAIPTLSEWSMIFLASLMGLFAFARIRRQS